MGPVQLCHGVHVEEVSQLKSKTVLTKATARSGSLLTAKQMTALQQIARQLRKPDSSAIVLFTGANSAAQITAAEVLATRLHHPLFRVDLSVVVSKYAGETEKSLKKIFEKAERADAILLFSEADALLGKRSDVKDSHDRFANNETGYMLQNMEDYKGLVIVSTSLRSSIDDAFRRRFVTTIPFPAGRRSRLVKSGRRKRVDE